MSVQERDPFEVFGEAVGEPDASVSERVERKLMQSLERREEETVSRWRWAAGVMAVAAAAAFALFFSGWRGPASEGASGVPAAEGAVAMSTSAKGQSVELSHGGVLTMAPNTSIRLDASEATGAAVELLEGEVVMDVHARPGLEWRVTSGDYDVVAVGTRYRVAAGTGSPQVVVEEGVVRMTGPGLGSEGVLLRPEPTELAEAAPADPPSVPVPVPVPVPGIEENAAENPTPPPTSRKPTWIDKFRTSIRNGEDDTALAALPPSFPTGRERLDPADYVDAGDALRAAGNLDRAAASYAAACKRAPKSNACGVARMRQAIAAGQSNDFPRAIELATQYLGAHPKGALARDALGRRMDWNERLGKGAAARADAEEYVRRWPQGSRAELARTILAE